MIALQTLNKGRVERPVVMMKIVTQKQVAALRSQVRQNLVVIVEPDPLVGTPVEALRRKQAVEICQQWEIFLVWTSMYQYIWKLPPSSR